MGILTYIYLGPYIECDYRVTQAVVQVQSCMNKKCDRYKDRQKNKSRDFGPPRADAPKFCATCGSTIGPCDLTVENRTDPYDLVGDALSPVTSNTRQPERVYLVANLNSKHTPRDFSLEDEEVHLDFTPGSKTKLDPKAEMDWLATKYAKQIAKLKTKFDNVEVKWGFHRYYS